MDYEKKYKDALEKAKKYKLKEDLIITQDIFPELAESKDERNQKIKNEVIEMLYYYHAKSPCFIPPQFSLEETLAWLEKQAESEDKGEISNMFATEKQAKSALAMARISQLMANDKRYGGVMTDAEWMDETAEKFTIERYYNSIKYTLQEGYYYFLAFHTPKQRELFISENEQLVKDYLMID